MLGFIIGCIVGGTIGALAMCCCIVASSDNCDINRTDYDE